MLRFVSYLHYSAEDCNADYFDFFYVASAECTYSSYLDVSGTCVADGTSTELNLNTCSDDSSCSSNTTCSIDTLVSTAGSACFTENGESTYLICDSTKISSSNDDNVDMSSSISISTFGFVGLLLANIMF